MQRVSALTEEEEDDEDVEVLDLRRNRTVAAKVALRDRVKERAQPRVSETRVEGGDFEAPRTPLKAHQEAGFRWMCAREDREHAGCSGGILADEAGLGKSLQVLHLISERNVLPYDPSRRVSRRTTLICSAQILVENWRRQILAHRPQLRFLAVDNRFRMSPEAFSRVLDDLDVLLVSYGQLSSGWKDLRALLDAECEAETRSKSGLDTEARRDVFWEGRKHRRVEDLKKGALRAVSGSEGLGVPSLLFLCGEFLRIVVDEAHVMRNDATRVFKALEVFPARSRWYVTGTPIVNYEGDLYSALRFLRLRGVETRRKWKKANDAAKKGFFSSSSSSSSSAGDTEKALSVLMCRREKSIVAETDASMRLPPLKVMQIESAFKHPAERRLHHGLYRLCRLKKIESDLSEAEKKKKVKKKRRRPQAPAKKKKKKKAKRKKGDNHEEEEEEEEEEEGEGEEKTQTKSFRTVLGLLLKARQCCYLPFFKSSSMASFPTSAHKEVQKLRLEDTTKMRMARAVLPKIPKQDSAVFFTQWVYRMEEVAGTLEKHCPHGKKCFVLKGEMKEEERWATLDAFERSEGAYLLASLTVGSVGLTIVSANWVIYLDQWWNPMIKGQARDRVYRQGQKKEVTVIDLIVKDSVESCILRLQDEKRRISEKFVVTDSAEGLESKTKEEGEEGMSRSVIDGLMSMDWGPMEEEEEYD